MKHNVLSTIALPVPVLPIYGQLSTYGHREVTSSDCLLSQKVYRKQYLSLTNRKRILLARILTMA